MLTVAFADPDLELGLLDIPSSPTTPEGSHSRPASAIDEDQNRAHKIIGDTLELFSRHLRA